MIRISVILLVSSLLMRFSYIFTDLVLTVDTLIFYYFITVFICCCYFSEILHVYSIPYFSCSVFFLVLSLILVYELF